MGELQLAGDVDFGSAVFVLLAPVVNVLAELPIFRDDFSNGLAAGIEADAIGEVEAVGEDGGGSQPFTQKRYRVL
jgi:hypothetical protein